MTRRVFQKLLFSAVLGAEPEPIPLLSETEFADVFDPEIQEQIRRKCSSRANSTSYIFTAIPPWTRAWVNWFRAQPADSPGKQQYVLFLKETYSYNINDVNKAYGIDSTSFTDLGQFNWSTAKLDAAKPRADDEEFLGWIAQTLFNTAADAIRKADPNHPIRGQKLGPNAPKSVREANAKVQEVGRPRPQAPRP